MHEHPLAILEIERILHLHLREIDARAGEGGGRAAGDPGVRQ